MKVSKIKVFLLLFLASSAFSCSKDSDVSDGGNASVSLLVTADGSTTEKSLSRTYTPVLNDLKVRLENTRGEVLKSWDYSNVPSPIKVVPGSYKLAAWYGSDTLYPAFETPYYYVESKFAVADGDNHDVHLDCGLAAVKVAIKFDESFDYDYDDYSVFVKTIGDSLEFVKGETREGYFKPGKLRLKYTLKPKGKNQYYDFYSSVTTNALAKDFYNLTLKSSSNNGALSIVTITTDSTVVEVVDTTILPGIFLPKPAPEVSSSNFTLGGVVSTTEGVSQKASMMILSRGGLTSLKLKTTSAELSAAGWPNEIDLMSASASQLQVLSDYGLEWDSALVTDDTIKSLTWVKFDNVAKNLTTTTGNTTSSFELVATDQFNQQCNEAKFSIEVQPPVFSIVGTTSDVNMFANHMFSTVHYVSEKNKPVIQYFDGANWIDATTEESDASGANDYLLKATNLVPETSYSMRVRLGSHSISLGSLSTEKAAQVGNNSFEDWNVKTTSQFSIGIFGNISYYDYMPYKTGETDIWWNTDNQRSMSWTVAPVYATTCPAVSYVNDAKTGSKAAEVRTTAGSGYAHTSSIMYSEGIIPGLLLIGSYSWDGSTETINPGHSFVSRPSKMSFWYKYTPYNSDIFEVIVELYNGSNKIASGRFTKQSDSADSNYQNAVVDLTYTTLTEKATDIYVKVTSSIETPLEAQKGATIVLQDKNSSWKAHVGSRLKIDDIELIY